MDGNIDKVREALKNARTSVAGYIVQEEINYPKVLSNLLGEIRRMDECIQTAIDSIDDISTEPAQDDGKPEANDNEQLDLVLKIRNDCTLDEALIAMQAFILYHNAEVKRRIEEAKE